MDLFLSICAIICGVVGILGAILPILPGPALSLLGMFCAHWTDYSTMSTRTLWIWAIITIIVTVLDYILPGYFSKALGGTRAGVIGATVGIFAGMLFMGPLGIIVGPFIGAVLGELLHNRQNLDKAITVGFGSLVSFLVGSGIKLVVSGFMMYYIWEDLYHALF